MKNTTAEPTSREPQFIAALTVPDAGRWRATVEDVQPIEGDSPGLRWIFRLSPTSPSQRGGGVISFDTGARFIKRNRLAELLKSLGNDPNAQNTGGRSPREFIGHSCVLTIADHTDRWGDPVVVVVGHEATSETNLKQFKRATTSNFKPPEVPVVG